MPDPVSHGQMMNYLVRNSEDKKRMREYFETNQITTASNINKPREPKIRQVFEEDISSDRLISADEIWCSSSTNYVVPITKVDDVIIQNGKVGDTTKEFYNLVTKFIQEL